MASTSAKNSKILWLAGLGLLFPIFLVGMALLAAKGDVETKREIDEMRKAHETKMQLQKAQQPSEHTNPAQ